MRRRSKKFGHCAFGTEESNVLFQTELNLGTMRDYRNWENTGQQMATPDRTGIGAYP